MPSLPSARNEGEKSPKAGPSNIADVTELTAEQLPEIRRWLTAYAQRIPHHGVGDLGAVAESVAGHNVPVYRVTLNTLYECRKVSRLEKPYSDWPVPELKVSEENIDVWAYDYPLQPGFVKGEQQFRVDDSQQVIDCPTCTATGTVTCQGCSGTTRMPCPTCKGQKIVRCPTCSGSGVVQNSRTVEREARCTGSIFAGCNGGRKIVSAPGNTQMGKMGLADSRFITNEACPICRGSGVVTKHENEYWNVACETCDQSGQVACVTCTASGEVVCATCKGEGKVTCQRCEGHGTVVSFLNVTQSLMPTESSEIVPCAEIHSKAVDLLAAQEFGPVLDYVGTEFACDPEASPTIRTGVPWLAENIGSMIAKAKAAVKNGDRIAKQQLRIIRADIIFVQYSTGGKDYELFLAGIDKKPYSISSPFTDFVRALLNESLRAWNSGHQSAAANYLRQCWEIAKHDPCSQPVIDEAKDRIPMTLKALATGSYGVAAVKAKLSKWFGGGK